MTRRAAGYSARAMIGVPISTVRPTVHSRSCDLRTTSGSICPRGIALIGTGERDPERHLDAGEVIARLVADFVRVDEHLEALWLSPA